MVSPLILEKLAHRHLGYDVRRWGAPESYPYHTLRGHLLALTNQFAGSDGDMFSYSFRELKMGPLLGKRTWGGVIGIDSRYQLVDGTTTTQPQYSIWFHKAGWNVENQGDSQMRRSKTLPMIMLRDAMLSWNAPSNGCYSCWKSNRLSPCASQLDLNWVDRFDFLSG